jgi:hypothetical protein
VGVLAIFTLIMVAAALTGKSAHSIRAETPTHSSQTAPSAQTDGSSLSPTPVAAPNSPASKSPTPSAPPVAVFVGDSYTTGAFADGVKWTSLVSEKMGWREVNLGRPGTGYFAAGDPAICGVNPCPNFVDMIPQVVAARPAIVVVSGGRNDGGSYPAQVHALFTGLRAQLPEAQIYAVSPLWDDAPTPQWLSELGNDVKANVTQVGGTYLDIGQPLEGRADYIVSGVYPNAEGQKAVAQAVLQALGAS